MKKKILTALLCVTMVAGLAAWLCPVEEENAKEEAHEA